MAKGLRSKVKRRWRALKRKVIDEAVSKPLCEKMNEHITATVNGYEYRQPKKKNAFVDEDPNAEFPQYQKPQIIDLRSAHIPFGGNEWVGARRKKVTDVQILVDNLHGGQTEFEIDQINELEKQIDEAEWNNCEDEDIPEVQDNTIEMQTEKFNENNVQTRSALHRKIRKDQKADDKKKRKARKAKKF